MLPENMFALGCTVLIFVMTSATGMTSPEKVRMCYFTNWSQYRQGVGRFVPASIDPYLCTHILYAFAHVDPDTNSVKLLDANDSYFYTQIIALKKTNPKLKVLLAVGGGAHGTEAFRTVAGDKARAHMFANNVVNFLRQNSFDGLDVDWEFPTEDTKEEFQLFVKIVSLGFMMDAAASGKKKLELTVAVSGDPALAVPNYGPQDFVNFVDYVLLMAYDLWGTWARTLGHHSPLNFVIPGHPEQGRFSMTKLVDEWTKNGVPKNKLVLGMSTYGHTGVLQSASQHQPGDLWARHMGTAGPITRLIGSLAYYEICDGLKSQQWTSGYSLTGQVPFAWNPFDLQYVCYDDTRSFGAKAQYILDEDLAGAMFWAMDYDDFSGKVCDAGPYPLLSKVKTILRNESDQESSNPASASQRPTERIVKTQPSTDPATTAPPSKTTSTARQNLQKGERMVTVAARSSPSELRNLPAQANVATTTGWTVCIWVLATLGLYKVLNHCCNTSRGRTRKARPEKEY